MVFDAPRKVVDCIIANFRFDCSPKNPYLLIEKCIKGKWVSDKSVRDISLHACGWVKRCTDELLALGKPAVIATDDFNIELTAFVRKVDRDYILASLTPSPTREQIEEHQLRTFVRQLGLVEADYDTTLAAITNFFRASCDRTLWGERGDVHSSTFQELDGTLTEVWRNLRMKLSSTCGQHPPCDQGRALLADCGLHRQTVQGMTVPDHFLPGCFHDLADQRVIGWHPDYINLLEGRHPPSNP